MGLRMKLRAAVKPVIYTEEEQKQINDKKLVGLKPKRVVKSSEILEVRDAKLEDKDRTPGAKVKGYATVEVKGSGDKIYKIVIPESYLPLIPKQWEWNEKRYKIAELIAAGYPMSQIARDCDVARCVIYGWLQHPEFKGHVDGLTMESGWANQRERVAGLNKVTRLLFDKVVNEIGQVKLTDKSIGAVLSSLQMIAKQIGQEKGEFIEQSKVEQDTTLHGAVAIAAIPVETLLNNKTSEEKQALEAEFNQMGDSVIRSITGEKE